MPPELPQQALTIFLIKEGLKLASIIPTHKRLTHQPFDVGDQKYDLFSKKPISKPPKWANFFPAGVDKAKLGKTSSPGAILLTTVDGRQYAFTFGTGRYFLEEECREDRFGLKVVLNSVSKVRSIDKDSFDSINGKTRTQASREFPIGLFGIDVEKDLLKAVTGIPTDPTLGSRMSGIDGLNVIAPIDIFKVPEFLRKLYLQSTREDYKKGDFAFVDQISSVSNKMLIDELNEELARQLDTRSFITGEIELILPDIVDFSEIEYFRYKHKPTNPENLLDISLHTFLTTTEDEGWDISVDLLKSKNVYSTHSNDEVRKVGSIFRCLLAELTLKGHQYVLSDGKWYSINSDYISKLDAYVAGVDMYPIPLPAFKHDKGEGEYNEFVRDSMKGYFLLDKDLVHPEKSQTFEFCDLYSEINGPKDMIHVKVGKASSSLSHLFSQGTVSAEAFLEFPEVRKQVDEKLRPYSLSIPKPEEKITTSDYRVVFGIIRKTGSKLPFFARVNLRQAFKMLGKWNYQPMLSTIDIDPAWLLTKSVTRKAKKKK